jgi:hypothetical protein
MAVSTDSVFSNAIVGQMMTGADVSIYDIDDLPKFPVGQGFTRADGCKFRYIHAGAAVNRGVIVAQDYSESSENDADQIIVAPSSTYQMADEPSGTYPGSINSRYVIVTLASVTADMFAGGYLHITDDVGEGFTYRIKGNTATDDPASGVFRLSLYDKIQVALTATTDHAITGNLYANVETAGTGTDGIVCGVTCASLTATEPYGWVQTYGVATVLCDTAGSAGMRAQLSQSVAGSYAPATLDGTAAHNYPIIGTIITPGDTTGHGAIFLQLE